MMIPADPARMLLAIAGVVVLARAAAWCMTRAGQPAVVGQLALGIIFGPSVLGGRLGRILLPAHIRPDLSLLGTLGVVLLTLLVALGLAPANCRELRTAGAVAAGSMLLPLAAGTAVGAMIAAHYRPTGTGELPFVLFVGAAIAITAFPVLARILAERGWEALPVGRLALSAAAIGDLVTWLLITAVLALDNAQGAHPGRLWVLIPYLTALLAARTVVKRMWARRAVSPSTELSLLIAGAVASAAVTDWMGLQIIFGAFLFGLTIPRAPARGTLERATSAIEPVVTVVLLPLYFVLTGLRVDLGHVGSHWVAALGLIALAAVGGKVVGVLVPARRRGLPWRSALILAALLDTRGLTEILVLTIGLQAHIISTELFSLLIVMALVTTLLTGPAINRLSRGRPDSETMAPTDQNGDLD